ncbi:hypothetical protein [Candidatus Burkholderia verschuerenii]|uniref:hypothetical protein n=1 Tax=Candidatus Burkholderia verschuerenii TaxID=242163 RepID=UPI000A594E7C|nr:hypothetical protein [Candidatus Burkholderia verschuerenii]
MNQECKDHPNLILSGRAVPAPLREPYKSRLCSGRIFGYHAAATGAETRIAGRHDEHCKKQSYALRRADPTDVSVLTKQDYEPDWYQKIFGETTRTGRNADAK